jgi:hypothetical protein
MAELRQAPQNAALTDEQALCHAKKPNEMIVFTVP